LSTESGVEGAVGPSESLEQFLVVIVNYITFGIDIAAGIIIGVSVALAFIGYMKTLYRHQKKEVSNRDVVRFRLAGGLLLALDFEVGSDILKTLVVPTPNELIILSVIVALRIILGWSLSKEITGHSEDLLRK
jgi:uncharacterized membrane protein